MTTNRPNKIQDLTIREHDNSDNEHSQRDQSMVNLKDKYKQDFSKKKLQIHKESNYPLTFKKYF
jgi:hypothetical protein